MMRVICFLLGLVMSLASLTGYAEGDQRIAVLELANPAGLAEQEVRYLSDLLRRGVTAHAADRNAHRALIDRDSPIKLGALAPSLNHYILETSP